MMPKPKRDPLYYPAEGTLKYQLPTPALMIDLPGLEFNLSLMSQYFEHRQTKLRPHFKTHKCPEIALKQIQAGAIGITCAKLSEAEVLVECGIPSILIANQVVGEMKLVRLAELARRSQMIVAVDQEDNLAQISRAAGKVGSTVHVLVEVDVGMHRSGVEPGEAALRLARKAATLPGIHFSGLLGYEGFTMFEVDRRKRLENSRTAMRLLVETRERIEKAGITVEIVTGGGTGTYDMTGDFQGVSEVEAGSYVFMDSKYNTLGLPFKPSLSLLSTVTSLHSPEHCIIDAGMKVLSSDNGLPEIFSPEGLQLLRLNEEHGIVGIAPGKAQPYVGDTVEILPSHVCTTVNLHDRYYVIEKGGLVDIWEIRGRGKSQ